MGKEMKHTAAPWTADNAGDGLWVTGADTMAPVICDLVPRDADVYTEEDEANAFLIAAAPDLLAAAEKVLAGLNARIDFAAKVKSPVPIFDGIADLSDAINKARGRR
jgi:hypothetical protein